MREIEVTPHFADKVFIHQAKIPAGSYVPKHKHDYDHFSYLGAGTVRLFLTPPGGATFSEEHTGPKLIRIKAMFTHHIMALTEVEWLCIHPDTISDPEGRFVMKVVTDGDEG